ncbi:MAG: stage IV sporulation protein A [Clostridiales bacterium]|nr:MAG: stage IV sporulation protein A [Clostridiales bacterium]
MQKDIYDDIRARTDGDIYIGVVGPVRTGKSTFIKKFMETLVIPNIAGSHKKDRAQDELPQSAAGKTIMTTEPKFIPNEAVEIAVANNVNLRVRLIDCVGYIVPSALGYIENDYPRMVMTPWFDEEVPFNMAAEVGTQKVISEHSTIGLVVTTDGSIGEIPREDFIEAEDRVINELKEINKPFVVVINTVAPNGEQAKNVREEIARKHGVSAITVDCLKIDENTIKNILENVLFEFPIKEIRMNMPMWVTGLSSEHWLRRSLMDDIVSSTENLNRIRDIYEAVGYISNNENINDTKISGVDLGTGTVHMDISLIPELFYKVMSELTGLTIDNDGDLMQTISSLSAAKQGYDKFAEAMTEADERGYGIVTPSIDELSLEEPQIVKQGTRFGVKLKASAPSYHIIKADIETEVSPVVGSEKQSEELVRFLLTEFEEDPKKIWDSNIFGKSLHELVNEGLHTKLNKMPPEAREKVQQTLEKIINEGSGGLICIIL